MARACVVVCVCSSDTLPSSFPDCRSLFILCGCGCLHTFSPVFLGELTLVTWRVYAVHPCLGRVPTSFSSLPLPSSWLAALLPSPVLALRVGAGFGGLVV